MSVYGESISGRAYTSDAHYAALQGRIVQQHTSTIRGRTLDGYVATVKRTIVVMDFGRVPPPTVDPNAAIGDQTANAVAPKAQSKTQQLLDSIYAALATKPMNTRQLAHATGATIDRVHGILRHHQAGLVVLAKSAWGHVYGLEGHDYPPLLTPTMQRIVDYLRTHGPTSTPALCDALNMHKATISKLLVDHPELVRQVGTQRAQGGTGGKRAQVWDLVEE